MDITFSERLKQACDASPYVPRHGAGRQAAIATRLNVTKEAASRYFKGSRPREEKMKTLADFLQCDPTWLAMGVKPLMDKKELQGLQRAAKGAVHLLAGMVALEGGNFAFPTEEDPNRKFVDIYAILRGTQVSIHVAIGRELENDVFEFVLEPGYESTRVVGLLPLRGGEVQWIDMPNTSIAAVRTLRTGDYVVHVKREGGKIHTDNVKWSRFKMLGEVI